MNESKDPNTDDNDLHDPDLHDEVVSRLYRQLPDESPAADTDALIRAAARREVGAGPRRRLVRLQKMLATAASLVLGVALVVQWRHHEPEKLAEVLATAPATPATEAVAPVPAAAPALEESTAVAAKPAAPSRNVAVQAPGEKEEKAYASGALAGAGSPLQSLAPAPAFAPQDMAPESTASQNAESLKKSRMEEQQADADMAASRERRFNAARESAAAAAPAASIAALRQDALKAEADRAPASVAPALPATVAYRNAMRQQQWPQALAELEKLAFASNSSLRIDHDILQRLSGSKNLPACAGLSAAELGAQSSLCRLLKNLAQGKPLPADALTQLEKAGLLSGEYDYRRPALRQLLQP
ncbi:MAG TPA: hypothetical protein VF050_01060 [Moraxellaceae bacterium]